MVSKDNCLYLFIGQDSFSKDIKLKSIKQEYLAREIEQFNLDILYAKELTLLELQEKLLSLPVRAKKRIIVIKQAEILKEDIKEFLLRYIKNPYRSIILILDISRQEPKDEFTNRISKYAQVYHFKEALHLDTFTLVHRIERKHTDYALRVLNQLLKNGEKPERILGGLRFAWERDNTLPLEKRRRLKLLLNCDIDIKTGRLKPLFALEKLVVNLCGPGKTFG